MQPQSVVSSLSQNKGLAKASDWGFRAGNRVRTALVHCRYVWGLCLRTHRVSGRTALLVAVARRNATEGARTADQPLYGHRSSQRRTAWCIMRLRPRVPPRWLDLLRHPARIKHASCAA